MHPASRCLKKKILSAVRESLWKRVFPLWAFLRPPQYGSAVMVTSIRAPMMPRDASLSDRYTSDGCISSALRKLYFLFVSHLIGYDRGDSFPFDFEPNGIPFDLKLKGKLSPRSYPIEIERKWKYSFLGALHSSAKFKQSKPKQHSQATKNTEKTMFPFPFTVNGIWWWWQFFFRF